MSRQEEVRELMRKGLRICLKGQWCIWAFAPTCLAEAMGTPFIAALPAGSDLVDYLALGGKLTRIP